MAGRALGRSSALAACFAASISIAQECAIGQFALPDAESVRKAAAERADLARATRDIVIRLDAKPKPREKPRDIIGTAPVDAPVPLMGSGKRMGPLTKEVTIQDGDKTVRMKVPVTVDQKTAQDAYMREKVRQANEPPLAAAIDAGDVEALRKLIASGADPRVIEKDRWGRPLGWVARAAGAWSTRSAEARADPAKQAALARNYIATIEALLSAGSDPAQKYYASTAAERIPQRLSNGERTPGAMELLARLLEKSPPIELNTDGRIWSLLDYPAGANDVPLLEVVMRNGRPSPAARSHALQSAFIANAWDTATALLDAGVDPNSVFLGDNRSLLDKIDDMPRSMIKRLLASKVDPNLELTGGLTPLMRVMHDHELMKDFLDHGADPNRPAAPHRDSVTALHLAVMVVNPKDDNPQWTYRPPVHASNPALRDKSVEILLKYRAQPTLRDKKGRTPLMLASPDDPRAIDRLLSAGASIDTSKGGGRNIPIPEGSTLGPVSWALVQGNETLAAALVRQRPQAARADCASVFHAAASGSVATLNALLDLGMSAQISRADDGQSPFVAAARGGHVATLATLLDRRASTIDEGTRPRPQALAANEKALSGVTALMVASSAGRKEVVQFLLDRGAQLNLADASGRTALDHARGSHEGTALVAFLEGHGATRGHTPESASEAGVALLLYRECEKRFPDFGARHADAFARWRKQRSEDIANFERNAELGVALREFMASSSGAAGGGPNRAGCERFATDFKP